MRRFFVAVAFVMLSAGLAKAEGLDVHKLGFLLSNENVRFDEGAEPETVSGATYERMSEVGAIALLTQDTPRQLLLVIDADRLCRVDGDQGILSRIDVGVSEALIGRLRDVGRQGRCSGRLIEGPDQSFHLFMDGVGGGSSEALWISEQRVVPVRFLPHGAPQPRVAEALFTLDPVPEVVLTFGATRFAFEQAGGVFVRALAEAGPGVILQICAPETDLPFFQQTPFNRYGAAQDAAFQAATYTDRDNLDPLAYVVCE